MLTISTSEIQTLSRCKRRYFFEYQLNRQPKQQNHELTWGGALHRGLEGLYAQLCTRGKIDLGHAIFCALTPGEDDQGRPYHPPTDPYARAALRAVLRAYVEYWWTDSKEWEIVGVEVPFDLPIKTRLGRLIKGRVCGDCGGEFTDCRICDLDGRVRPHREGKLDLVMRIKSSTATHPGAWIFEHKSTGWAVSDERYYAGMRQDLQIALYFDAAQEMGLNPQGVIYDVIRRPDYDDPKPEPKRAPGRVTCGACENGFDPAHNANCEICNGTGKVIKPVVYSNPRFGESAAQYEERIYQLATAEETRDTWFARRKFEVTEAQITKAREICHSAAYEIQWRERTKLWPEIGDRRVCCATNQVCPWLDVCDGRTTVEDERLYQVKVRRPK